MAFGIKMKKFQTLILFPIILSFILVSCMTTGTKVVPTSSYSKSSGREFTFALIYEGGQSLGYHSWYRKPDSNPKYKLPYEKYVGRKGKLIGGVLEKKYHSEFGYQKAILETGEVVYTSVNRYSPKYYQVSFNDESVKAKSLINKTIYILKRNSPGELITSVRGNAYPIHNLEPVKVVGIVKKSYGHARGVGPFFLKVRKSSGEEGMIKFNNKYFSYDNPIPSGTTKSIVNAIRNERIQIGMTEQQAILAWGEPKMRNKSVGSWGTHEQWVYGSNYLYFRNGRLDSFQTP